MIVFMFPGKEIFIALLPMFHIIGMGVNVLKGPFLGASSVILPRFEPQLFLDTIKKHQVRIKTTENCLNGKKILNSAKS